MNNIFQINTFVFKKLLKTKLTNIFNTLKDKLINFYIWAICCLLVAGYLMQSFGLAKDFGPFQLGGILASAGLFELYTNAVIFVSDMEGDKTISYYLTLPTTALTVLCSYVCYYTIITTTMSIFLLPLAKLILWNQFSLASVAWLKLIFFILLINFVYATATILLSALIPSMDKFDILWTRFIFPLWFLGGFQFSWQSVNAKVPVLSYIMLLNPITYTTEGIRAAMLGQAGCLNFWICSAVLLVLCIFVGFWAYKALKTRLDFVA